MTRAFGVELDAAVVAAIAAHGERDYPVEACGLVVGPPTGPHLSRVEPLANTQDRYHQRDPARFTRSGRDAFRLDELARMRLLERLEGEGLVERVLYHSHCDAGAYFSPEDRAMAVIDGLEMLPGVVHVVVSIREGRAAAMAAFRYDAARGAFDEVRVPLDASAAATAWPDLAARAMEGRAASRPIRPVGGRLLRRLISATEAASVSARAEARVEIDEAAHRELRRLGTGLWSPARGFGPSARDPTWPVGPSLAALRPAGLPAGAVVELMRRGVPLAALRLDAGSDLDGEVLVYPAALDPADVDAADLRAELLRRGVTDALVDLSAGPALITDRGALALPPLVAHPHPWARALMSQNLGATRVTAQDPATDDAVRQTLDLSVTDPAAPPV